MILMQSDSRSFRDALGVFPTGVCVVTTPNSDTTCLGITISSFNSVSLEPPLILWSLGKSSGLLPVFLENAGFIVNVLPAGSDAIAMRFAGQQDRTIHAEECTMVPQVGARLKGALAVFECAIHETIEAGDHVIFIGRVMDFTTEPQPHALGFFSGKFCTIAA